MNSDMKKELPIWKHISACGVGSANKMAADGPEEYSSLEGIDAWDLAIS